MVEAIKETLETVIKALEAKKQATLKDSPEVWLKKILTKKEFGHIKVNYFNRGVLSVNVDSSSWLYILGLRKQDLLQKLRKQKKEIKDLRLCLG